MLRHIAGVRRLGDVLPNVLVHTAQEEVVLGVIRDHHRPAQEDRREPEREGAGDSPRVQVDEELKQLLPGGGGVQLGSAQPCPRLG